MIIDRYLARVILQGIVLSGAVFAGLFLFINFIKQLKYVGVADYDVLTALYFVVLGLPLQLFELAPSIILVGSLVSLGALAATSELVVLRASGWSTARISRSVLQTGLLVAVLVTLFGEYIAPPAASMAQSVRVQALHQQVIAGGANGFWSRDDSQYISIGKVMPDRQLIDINIYTLDENRRLQSSLSAAMAYPSAEGWQFVDVRRSHFTDQGVSSETQDSLVRRDFINADLFDVLKSEPQDMSLRDLHRYTDYLQQNNLDAAHYQLQYWIKLLTPITCVVMLLLALPLVFSSQARSGGVGQRVIIGLAIGILFYLCNRLINHLGLVYGLPPVLSACLPPLLVATAVVLLMRRV